MPYGFTAPLHGVGRGIVGAPACSQALLVAEFFGAFDVDDARGETITADIFVEVDFHVRVAMTGVLDVAEGHIQR